MKVKVAIINQGTKEQHYVLVNANSNEVLHSAPYYKTINGSKKWASKNGYEFID